MIRQFKKLVDQTTIDPAFTNQNLATQYRLLALSDTNGMSLHSVTSELGERITQALRGENEANRINPTSLNQLRKALVFEMVIIDCDNSRYLNVANTLWHYIRRNLRCAPISTPKSTGIKRLLSMLFKYW